MFMLMPLLSVQVCCTFLYNDNHLLGNDTSSVLSVIFCQCNHESGFNTLHSVDVALNRLFHHNNINVSCKYSMMRH